MNARFVLAIAISLALVAASRGAEPTTDSLDMVKDRITQKTAMLVDVREPKEWESGHLRAAVSVPLSVLKAGADSKEFPDILAQQLPKEKIIYLHCASGVRSLAAADILKKMGYDARPLKVTYQDLLDAGFIRAK